MNESISAIVRAHVCSCFLFHQCTVYNIRIQDFVLQNIWEKNKTCSRSEFVGGLEALKIIPDFDEMTCSHHSCESLRRPPRGNPPYTHIYRRCHWGRGSHCVCRERSDRGQTAACTHPRPSADWLVWDQLGQQLCWSALVRKLAWSATLSEGKISW